MTSARMPRPTSTAAVRVVRLPVGRRARAAYTELRRMGYKGTYAASVVATLEHARSNLERWAMVQQALHEGPDAARGWLKSRGY